MENKTSTVNNKNKMKSISTSKKKSASKKSPTPKNNTGVAREKYNADDLVFALDIGTHSVIGMLGIRRDTKIEVLDIVEDKYPVRAMVDGQIQDIDMVSKVSLGIKNALEKSCNVKLKNVYVAAAGRTLKTVESKYVMTLDEPRFLDEELITQINSKAIEAAENEFNETIGKDSKEEYYLSGYSISEYVLDGYPMPTLSDHHGKIIEAKAIVTFLPREVVESLYTTTAKIGLEVAGLTLEPIAAMNAVIPGSIRLLNLALVDIGAGTSDIAISRDGSVIGYTMVTVAGDEITEAIMKKLLVDFETAEEIKLMMDSLNDDENIKYKDILYMDHEMSLQELKSCILDSVTDLAKRISDAILGINKTLPSAIFLVGGGSRLAGFTEILAKTMGMDSSRVAIGGSNFEKTAFSKKIDIKKPFYATCLGIAVSAGFDTNKEGFFIRLNGKKCRLFRTGSISVFDILLMNGYTHKDLFARRGESVSVTFNGQKKTFFGELSEPAVINVNGEEAKPTTILKASDNVNFIPARQGKAARAFLRDLVGDFKANSFNVFINNTEYLAGSYVSIDGRNLIDEPDYDMELYNNCDIQVQRILTLTDLAKYYGISGKLYIDGTNSDILTKDCIIVCEDIPIIPNTTDSDKFFETSEAKDIKEVAVNEAPEINTSDSPAKDEVSLLNETITEPEVNQAMIEPTANQAATIEPASVPLAKIDVQRIPISHADAPRTNEDGSSRRLLKFFLNGTELELPEKREGKPYILSDMLIHTGFDFSKVSGSFITLVNGAEASFTTILRNNDRVTISIE